MRYAVITHHPSGQDRLQVHSWHATEADADAATLRMVMEWSNHGHIPPELCGLATVREDDLSEVVPGHEWTWVVRRREMCPQCRGLRPVTSVPIVGAFGFWEDRLEALQCGDCAKVWVLRL